MFDHSGFLESLKNYSMTTIPAGTEQEVLNVAGSMSYLAYRWLTYQIDLDGGLEDQKLADQQHEFDAINIPPSSWASPTYKNKSAAETQQ